MNIKDKHYLRYTRFYSIWCGIKTRCLDFNSKDYKNYGNRGIKICEEWMYFINFKNDMYDSYMEFSSRFGEKNATIDRIDNSGNYFKQNCRWATRKEQNNNKRHGWILRERNLIGQFV